MKEQHERFMKVLEDGKKKLVEHGFIADSVEIKLVEELYPTVADGIIDHFNKGKYDLVVIGRKRMSKAEEFVLGDPSVKLVRALDDVSIMVVKCK